MHFNANGSVVRVTPTDGIANSLQNLNPFVKTKAATIAWEEGIETATDSLTRNVYVTDISNGDYIKVRSVDFGKGAKSFEANIASASEGNNIEIRLDSLTGTLLAKCAVKNTGGMQKWATIQCKTEQTTGAHDVYFAFKGVEGNLFNFDSWKFKAK